MSRIPGPADHRIDLAPVSENSLLTRGIEANGDALNGTALSRDRTHDTRLGRLAGRGRRGRAARGGAAGAGGGGGGAGGAGGGPGGAEGAGRRGGAADESK